MIRKKDKFWVFILIAIGLAFLQILDKAFFGVKPNLVLAMVVASSFFLAEIWEGLFLAALLSFILKFSAFSNLEILIFFLISGFIFLVNKYLPWEPAISNNLFLIFFTLAFYLILMPREIISWVFLLELVYNLIAGNILYLIFLKIKPLANN